MVRILYIQNVSKKLNALKFGWVFEFTHNLSVYSQVEYEI